MMCFEMMKDDKRSVVPREVCLYDLETFKALTSWTFSEEMPRDFVFLSHDIGIILCRCSYFGVNIVTGETLIENSIKGYTDSVFHINTELEDASIFTFIWSKQISNDTYMVNLQVVKSK
jgi:hypothetical protein